eukprot:TRINITY_DN4871_c0_g1_i4.p1 TRINITY_DN4871_c0_g1~~TRINITY_DN4871_c0_g1_i4.p1  ORF type:complete len:611 (+),score=65.89 TRINITY_DN4871_c0_g1_i4:991-2823(+)
MWLPRFFQGPRGCCLRGCLPVLGYCSAGQRRARCQNYDLWGDTINVASRMASLAPPDSIQLSEETFNRVSRVVHLTCARREVKVKGHNDLHVGFVPEMSARECVVGFAFPRVTLTTSSSLRVLSDKQLSRVRRLLAVVRAALKMVMVPPRFRNNFYLHWRVTSVFGVVVVLLLVTLYWLSDLFLFCCPLAQYLMLLVVPVILCCYLLSVETRQVQLCGAAATVCGVVAVMGVAFSGHFQMCVVYTHKEAPAGVFITYPVVYLAMQITFNFNFATALVVAAINGCVSCTFALLIPEGKYLSRDVFFMTIVWVPALSCLLAYLHTSTMVNFFKTSELLVAAQQSTEQSLQHCQQLIDSVIPVGVSKLGISIDKLLSQEYLSTPASTEVPTKIVPHGDHPAFPPTHSDEGFSLFTYRNACVVCVDVVGFTQHSAVLKPLEVVEMLNNVFSLLDDIAVDFGLCKIKTIGDAVMYIYGACETGSDSLDSCSGNFRVCQAVACARKLVQAVMGWCSHDAGDHIPRPHVRAGCATGTVLAGVITTYKFQFDIYGEAVDQAEYLSSVGGTDSLSICPATWALVQEEQRSFDCDEEDLLETTPREGAQQVCPRYFMVGV